eukprot:2084201-Lingulodinium_polyedra.AAC.1
MPANATIRQGRAARELFGARVEVQPPRPDRRRLRVRHREGRRLRSRPTALAGSDRSSCPLSTRGTLGPSLPGGSGL